MTHTSISNEIFDRWEKQPAETRKRVIAGKLSEYIDHASKLSFYRKRLATFDADALHPLAGTPVLCDKELSTLLPPKSDKLISRDILGRTIFHSVDAAGSAKTAIFAHSELESLYLPNARGFHAAGLKTTDRVANLFAVNEPNISCLYAHRMLQEFGCINFPFTNQATPEMVHSRIKLFNINCITGIGSDILKCLRGFKNNGLKGIKLDKVFYCGRIFADSEKNELREQFGIRHISAVNYGPSATWNIGYQCGKCATGTFHAHDDQVYIELVNENTKEHCEPGEPGVMFVTTFQRLLTPLVRYKTGDIAKWREKPCSCGRTTPLFEILNR